MRRTLPYLALGVALWFTATERPLSAITVIAALVAVTRLMASDAEPPSMDGPRRRAVVIVTVFNERLETIGSTLRSLAAQTWPPERVVLVDDGSDDPSVVALAALLAPSGLQVEVFLHEQNLGKREAIGTAVRAHPDAEVYVSVDSDTRISANALEALVSRVHGGVTAATGMIAVENRARNVLTRLQDVLYTGAFVIGRASQSRFGAVLVCSGALSAYDGEVVRRHLADFASQTFAGRKVTSGDDRRLTSFALRYGRVVFCPEAIGWTAVPERLSMFVRQQVRWARSWARESWLVLVEQPARRPQWWLALADVALWVFFAVALVATLALTHWSSAGRLLGGYALAALVMSPARGIKYLTHRPDLTLGARLAGLALSPLYSVLHTLIGLPVRLYAIATMFDNSWGTRQGRARNADSSAVV